MKFYSEFVWLAKQLDQVAVSKEPSLWKALREQDQHVAATTMLQTKRHVYITGEAPIVYKLTDLFHSVTQIEDVITLTVENSTHPALQWMNITYYSPSAVQQLPKNKALTLFTENRLPLWSRSLFLEKKISNVVVTENIKAISNMQNVKQFVFDDFSYEFLLDDVLPQASIQIRPKEQLYPEPSKQYVLQIMATTNAQQQQRALILDKMAAQMLNTYWLQNHPPVQQWLPILLSEIAVFLAIRTSEASNEKVINEMKAWGIRDKRINGA